MPNRLADAVSPYLRSHAENPVDWWPWGEAAFAEAERRDVPLLVSIGYSTCHWCHVMARESFSDPVLAAYLNANFVSVKVDREEHPDVDTSYLGAAGAFTDNLGWPLNVFVTPRGRTFFAGTYWPPSPANGQPAFRQVLDAVLDAWTTRRDAVEETAAKVAEALAETRSTDAGELPTEFAAVVAELVGYEDETYGGFGGAPKFPVAPVLLFLLERASTGDDVAMALARRTLVAMAASELRDPGEGGFFRYATRRDWTEPHYERMLYDNALLLEAYTRLEQLHPEAAPGIAAGIAGFLLDVLRRPGGGFASAQDSESTVDGVLVEGGYYALDAAARARQSPPALDAKVLTGWNGMAIGALATAGLALGRPEWITAAAVAADFLLDRHRAADGTLIRASIDDRRSDASATLEDYGMFAAGLLRLAAAGGDARYAVAARSLVDATLTAGMQRPTPSPFAVPGGADPSLAARGLVLEQDASEGAYPSGTSALADAAQQLFLLTADRRYLDASRAAMRSVAGLAVPRPISFGSALAVMSRLAEPIVQVVAVGGAADSVRSFFRSGGITAVVDSRQAAGFAAAGFELFEGRDRDAVYLCRDFVCRLPESDPGRVAALLASF
jgi:uncharacterized protein YyaL (SSP411 family)